MCITGVPVSTQWESQGYYYPTQIAQFGLSHYSKNLTEPEPRHTVLEDGERDLAHWVVPGDSALSRELDAHSGSHVVQFSSPGNFYVFVRLELIYTSLSMHSYLFPLLVVGNMCTVLVQIAPGSFEIFFHSFITPLL